MGPEGRKGLELTNIPTQLGEYREQAVAIAMSVLVDLLDHAPRPRKASRGPHMSDTITISVTLPARYFHLTNAMAKAPWDPAIDMSIRRHLVNILRWYVDLRHRGQEQPASGP